MAELNTAAEKGNGSKRKSQNLRVDLTAMVDLAFLLVTFFMLTTTLSKPKAMDVAMPSDEKGDPGAVSDKRTVTVCLGNGDKALLYSGLIENAAPQVVNYGKAGLRDALLQKQREIFKATGKDMIVLVKPSAHSKYGNLVDALDELHITKVNRFAIVDITPGDVSLLQKQMVY